MPYKDPETQRQWDRERKRKWREKNPSKPPNGGEYWMGSEQDPFFAGQLMDIDSNNHRPRYNMLTTEGKHVSLEQTSELRRLLAVNEVVTGDFIRVKFTGIRWPKKPDPRRHPYKTYQLTVVARRSSVLSGIFKSDPLADSFFEGGDSTVN